MSEQKILDGVAAYRNLTPDSIEVLRALTDEEAIAVAVCLRITEAPKVGRPRKKKAQEGK